jgi:death on curing protein
MTLEDVLYIHHLVIEDYGGVHGVSNAHGLSSAVDKLTIYNSPLQATAFFVRDVIQGHPFIDGNKRTAITVMGMYLYNNALYLTATPTQLDDFAIMVATKKSSPKEIEKWLTQNTQPSTY